MKAPEREHIEDQIRLWECQIFILDREIKNEYNQYNKDQIKDFIIDRQVVKQRIEKLSKELANVS